MKKQYELETRGAICYNLSESMEERAVRRMITMLFPWERAKSVFSIDYQKLYDLGYRAVLFDIDNTATIRRPRWMNCSGRSTVWV